MSKRTRGLWRKALIAVAICGLAGVIATPAQANFGITGFGGSTTLYGQPSRQAGEHADLTTRIDFASRVDPKSGLPIPDEDPRDVEVDLPPGLLGNPTTVPTCTQQEMLGGEEGKWATCPPESQVGLMSIYIAGPRDGRVDKPIYSLEPPANLPALFGFNYYGAIVTVKPQLRAGDFGIVARSNGIAQVLPVFGVDVTFWGVPADPVHDVERWFATPTELRDNNTPSADPPRPFMTNPTSCPGTPEVTSVRADSWDNPGLFSTASFDADLVGAPFITEGCDRLRFGPTLDLGTDTHLAGAPTGMKLNFTLPQSNDPRGLATAALKKTVLTFPKGVTVSSSAAAGLGACSPAQIDLGSVEPPSCPASSRIGSVKLKTPLLAEELEGDVILAKQRDNPFGSLLALYLAIKGSGFVIKLPGKIDADPNTGQLTATFDDAPQLPFSSLQVAMRGGPQAPLVVPDTCGTYETKVQLTSWASSIPLELSSPMQIDEGCNAPGFDPKLRAGTANPIGGDSSPFSLQVTRQDGEQNLSRLDVTLPEGLLAKLAGVPLRGEAAASSGNCPAGSQIGTTTVGVGAGTSPIYVPQPGKSPTAVYLAGPYKGAPYSLVVKVPAQAGPFDLGTVTVRNGIYVDPVTVQAQVKSDALPQILEGIPVSYRDVRVEVDRQGFMRNPTSCDPMKVTSNIASSQGKSANPSARFQAAACGELGFAPKLAMKLSGPTHRSAHPKLRATLTMPKGGANIARAAVTLPKTELLENAHIQTVCTRVQYAAQKCPARSVYGYAKAWSPLLDKPLQGPVYLRSSSHELPDLVASLDGQIHVDVSGRIDATNARIRNTFDFLPDAPVSKFVLTMQGGKKGLLVNNTELCKATPRLDALFDAQNGKAADLHPVARADCGKGRRGR